MNASVNGREASASPRHDPIFLLCPPRSYSTVTTALLSGHPDIYGFPEMLLFQTDTVAGLMHPETVSPRAPRFAGGRLNGILRAVSDLLEGSQESSAIDRAKEWLAERSAWSPPELMDYLLALAYPKIGLEKSPETVSTDEALDACIEHFPHSRFIHLTRHPATTVRSAIAYWSVLGMDERLLLAYSATSWYQGHSRIMRKLSQLPGDRWLRVRAEDVVGDPVTGLPYILDWLGLHHDTEVVSRMMQTQDWRFAGTGQSGRLYGGDAKFMCSPALRPIPPAAEGVFDPSWGLPDEVIARMTSLGRSLGYS